MPLEVAGVLTRREEGVPEVHVTEVADELVQHWLPSRMLSPRTKRS